MKQFLRFQISGLTCLFWLFVFFLPYVDISFIHQNEAEKIVAVVLTLITLALPLGTIIHQISISLFSPFRKNRILNIRHSLEEANDKINDIIGQTSDKKQQYKIILSQSIHKKWHDGNMECELDIEHIRDEISNRYSYYYVRVDNGFLAPSFGFILFLIFKSLLELKECSFINEPVIPYFCLPLFALAISIIILLYVPALLREVDDLERLLLNFKK